MNNVALIHLEHALPALADLGLEHLVPLLPGAGGAQALSTEAMAKALQGLSGGAEKRAARVLVAIAKASGEELVAWETDKDARERALLKAALTPFEEAKQAVAGFFSSLAPSLLAIQSSSETGAATAEGARKKKPKVAPSPTSAP